MTTIQQPLDSVRQRFLDADGIVILTGAGMGVDGGIPDFRGKSGVWTSDKETFMKFASGPAWEDHPLDTWNFYISRFLKYRDTVPHAGYYELLDLVKSLGKDYFVLTSNVDGHHKKAGYEWFHIYEIHGNLEHIQCSKLCCDDTYPMPEFTKTLDTLDEAPQCPRCGSVMRPAVLMFNDNYFCFSQLDKESLKYTAWVQGKKNLVGIEIGAGTAVPSLRDYGRRNTSMLVRINPHESSIYRPQDISIPQTAIEGIRTLKHILTPETHNEPSTV